MWIQVLSGPDHGKAVELPAGVPFVLGRQQGCDLVVRDERASRRHAQLEVEGDHVRLTDLGSANGTQVAGEPVTERLLRHGEEFAIGDVRFKLAATEPRSRAESLPTYSSIRRLIDHSTKRTRRTALAAAAIAAVALVALLVVLIGGGEDDPVPEVVGRLAPATVRITALKADTRTGSGSGWVLDAREGLIVTNAHVVNQGETFTVGESPAKIVGVSPCDDLALLQTRDRQGLRSAALGDGASVEQGERVVALGYPSDGGVLSSTTGVVSAPKATFDDPAPDVPPYPEAVLTDTALNPGNSGGPLVDLDARVIGVNAAARSSGSDGRPLQGQNYAIAIDRVKAVLQDLRKGRSRGWTGATFGYPTNDELAEQSLPPGVEVTGAVPDTPAAEKELDGLLVGVQGRAIANTLASYCKAIEGLGSGDMVTLSFAIPGREDTRSVRIPLA